jgi:hypothetical protein
MKALTHITAGRTVIKALLVTVVVTVGVAGTVGTAAAEPIDGKGNDVYPPPGVYASLDGKGDGAVTSAFPSNNVTAGAFSVEYAGESGGSGKANVQQTRLVPVVTAACLSKIRSRITRDATRGATRHRS